MSWERLDAGWFSHHRFGSIHKRGHKRWWWYPPAGPSEGPFRNLKDAKDRAEKLVSGRTGSALER